MMLKHKRIILGVTGGIAAYKSAFLVRLLREQGAEVQVVMTESAKAFITPMTLQALSGMPVRSALFDCADEHAMGHITLARWCDAIVIAPTTADCMAKLAHGFADDLLTTLCLATTAPVMIAPAMNQQMWKHQATQDNIAKLIERGVAVLGPDVGEQACGEFGEGRMLSPEALLESIKQSLTQESSPEMLNNFKVVVTAGPTYEPIDPVRFVGNRSSGKMGYALAKAWRDIGAEVVLISGPTALPKPDRVDFIAVESSEQMAEAVMSYVSSCQLFIGTAAVSDYQASEVAPKKIKKQSSEMQITLKPTRDIIGEVAALPKRPFVVGFAAETDQVLIYAKQKMQRKQLDMIVANQVGQELGFGQDNIAITLINPKGEEQSFPMEAKERQAIKLVEKILCLMKSGTFQTEVSVD